MQKTAPVNHTKSLHFTAQPLTTKNRNPANNPIQFYSSNMVGYQNNSLEFNYNFTAATFVPVSKTKTTMTFGDIGVNENVTYMGTTIQLLTDTGATQYTDEYEDLGEVALTFTYVTTDMGAPSDGWYLQDDFAFEHPQNDRILKFGQGILVDCSDAGAALVYAGSVSKEDTEVELDFNYNFTGNCSPSGITFGDIAVNENVTYMGTTFQLLTDTGATQYTDEYEDLGEVALTFTYVTTDMGAPSDGWYLQDDFAFEHPQNDRELAAGAGILVDCSDAEATLTFPAAL